MSYQNIPWSYKNDVKLCGCTIELRRNGIAQYQPLRGNATKIRFSQKVLETVLKHKNSLHLMKTVVNGQVLTKNLLFLHFIMRKIRQSPFSYNRKGTKAKVLFANIYNYNFAILFCFQQQEWHVSALNANNYF